MVLSSWQSHCESSPGSSDECSMAPKWPPTQDQARQLRLWVHLYRLPETTPTIAIYYYYSDNGQTDDGSSTATIAGQQQATTDTHRQLKLPE